MKKKERRRLLREVRELIERKGGMSSISEATPDFVLEMFHHELMSCPDCRALPDVFPPIVKATHEH